MKTPCLALITVATVLATSPAHAKFKLKIPRPTIHVSVPFRAVTKLASGALTFAGREIKVGEHVIEHEVVHIHEVLAHIEVELADGFKRSASRVRQVMHDVVVPMFHQVLPHAACMGAAAGIAAAGVPSLSPLGMTECETLVGGRRADYEATANAAIAGAIPSETTTFATATAESLKAMCTKVAQTTCEAQSEKLCGEDLRSAGASPQAVQAAYPQCHSAAESCANAVDFQCMLTHHLLPETSQ